MNTKMQFQKDAAIVASNGQHVGILNRIVVNVTNRVLTDIVVRPAGNLFNREEKVIPIDLVSKATKEQIVLDEQLQDLSSLEVFKGKSIVEVHEPFYPKPFLESASLVFLEGPNPSVKIIPELGDQFVTVVEQHIPINTVAIKEGAKVITADGKHVGNIESVFADSEADQITHLLISTGLIAKEKKVIPINWVMTIGDNEIHLLAKNKSIEELDNISVNK